MDVSIVIVNYRTKHLVRECLRSFAALSHSIRFECIVVDNGRDPGLKEMLRSNFAHAAYIPLRENRGFSAGVNTGISLARGTYVFVLNPDATALPGVLDRLFEYMEAHPDVGIAGPQLLNPDRSIQQSYYRFYRPLTPFFRRLPIGRWKAGRAHLDHFLMKDADPTRGMEVDWLLGAALFVRRSAIERVGMMDSERFFLYFEDTDWCKRFWQAGFRVCYVPQAQMIHLYKRDSAQKGFFKGLFDRAARAHMASGVRFFIKHRKDYVPKPFGSGSRA